jgi:REP-associated tyrosine transposase
MPRLARLDAPGVLHYVIIRGMERRKIFWDEKDCEDFVERLGYLLPESETTCYVWALLRNHAHFLLRTGQVALAEVMRRLLTGYAVRFNRCHRRHGHLFQNRCKSMVSRAGKAGSQNRSDRPRHELVVAESKFFAFRSFP